MRAKLFLPAVLAVFTASGFAGLIYESIWSHYLKLFLGHAAYAQTLVLTIFMGGMAIGAWAASRLSSRLRDLLFAYALIEAAIGITSLFFHQAFVAMTAVAFDHVIPMLGSPAAVQAFKWSLAAALILPQSVLLGATFPLLTGGVLRLRPDRAGYAVAMLYFTNSLGAAAGVLASGFYFIAAAGLPGTLVAAGVVNLAVAVAAFVIRPPAKHAVAPVAAPAAGQSASHLKMLLAVAALTGASSFMYEIGWIRMLSLVLGSSTHAFELMLSAFILGIAFGGLAIRKRIDVSGDPLRMLGWVQVAMGLAALVTLPVYGSSFVAMQTAVQVLAPTETGYVAFNFVSHAICLAVMFPAAFCAGMTLPIITATLLRSGAGERAIGQVYAANTAGAIVGVFAAVHVGMALLGLKGLIVAGAAIDLALGVVLLGTGVQGRRRTFVPGLVAAAALIGVLAGVQLDAHRMASGVFRTGVLLHAGGPEQAVLQIDGKTATISVTASGSALALRTNGKSEGVIELGARAPAFDEAMMVLLGALPQFLTPEAKEAATIGFGTGLTSHVLLASAKIETLDTIEIEPAVLVAAQRFRPRNARALDDPRSRVHFDDAKTYFSAQQKRYDVIVSEPSNPWVSGVSGLFSREFYGQVRRYLRDGGLFLQWVHVYEMTPVLIATIIGALGANFDDFEIWMPTYGDMIVVAVAKGKVPRLDDRAFANPLLRGELERLNIRNKDDLLLHRVGGREALAPYYRGFGVRANSDFAPVLDLNAPLARFLREQVDDMPRLMEAPIPVLALFDRPRVQPPDPTRFSPGPHPWLYRAERAKQAQLVEAYLRTGRGVLEALPPQVAADLALLRAGLVDCKLAIGPATARRALFEVAALVNAHLARSISVGLWKRLASSGCARSPETASWLRLHAAIAGEDAAGMTAAAQALLRVHLGPELVPYVVAAHMTGLLLGKDGQGALRSFQANRARLGAAQAPWEPVFRFLIGQTVG